MATPAPPASPAAPTGSGWWGRKPAAPSSTEHVSPNNKMAPGQKTPLPTERVRSSIPMGDFRPAHQPAAAPAGAASAAAGSSDAPGGAPVWVYPSPQMFYNAMLRKGWRPAESDMGAVVGIHNAVNERAWREVMRWEAMHAAECGRGPRLVKFQGRPKDYSPKARLLNALGYTLPFDRHDWTVDRCGTQVRYVIDFYNARPEPGGPAAMHLDVRPALDSVSAAWDRLRMQATWVASGRWLGQESAPGGG